MVYVGVAVDIVFIDETELRVNSELEVEKGFEIQRFQDYRTTMVHMGNNFIGHEI